MQFRGRACMCRIPRLGQLDTPKPHPPLYNNIWKTTRHARRSRFIRSPCVAVSFFFFTPHGMSTFASVTKSTHVLRVTAHRSHPFHNEFSELVHECETMYTQYSHPFVLAMDLHLMGTLHPFDALQWMMMFYRVAETTKEHLICTCILASSTLDDAINGFLQMYDPIKPFHSFKASNAFDAEIAKGITRCTTHLSRGGPSDKKN